MTSQLESLRMLSTVVADTGDIEAIARLAPRDATTNPTLLLAAVQDARYGALVDAALAGATGLDDAMDRLAVGFGAEILRHIAGRVSTEVDARLSFDSAATAARARRLIALYAAHGIGRERVLIKIASTWEGIRAAETLEREAIRCNLTLLFGFGQALACADAGVTLVSPFVGRIYDWHRAARGVADIPPEDDPGVQSVTRIWACYRHFGYRTEVMGASFRKPEQVTALAGCDLLTVSPELLDRLAATPGSLERRLDPARARAAAIEREAIDETRFRRLLAEDAMASEKLAEGIRRFDADTRKLESWVGARLAARRDAA